MSEYKRCPGIYPHVWSGINCHACLSREVKESMLVKWWRKVQYLLEKRVKK